MGRLIEVIDERRTHKLGIARRAMIAEVLVDQQWRFQQTRDRSIERVLTRVKEFQVTLVQNAEDIVTWKSGEEEFKRFFSAFNTWNMIRTRYDTVPWSKLIWRHSQRSRPATQVGRIIEKTIRQRLLSTSYYEKKVLEGLMQRWFLVHIG
ncbi:hypothetical protein YC2023_117808 [Brassica napus]|uniref:Uncharacterized protein n=1 Tax=Brassica oleracea TaxID=3712 RepID=A0A3P6E6R1_BRAOL|nr:unnamed protein product [Brassica oleracea]